MLRRPRGLRVLDDNLAHTGTPPDRVNLSPLLPPQQRPLIGPVLFLCVAHNPRLVGAPRLWTLNSIGVVDSHWGFSYFSSSVSRASSPSA